MAGVDIHKSWLNLIIWTALLLPNTALGQGWEINLGGDGPIDCSTSYSILEDDDGNFLSVGNSDFTHPDSIYAVKISKFGDVLWTKNYGGGVCYDLVEAPDGNYIGVGTSSGANASFVAKIKPDGDVLFTNIVGFNSSFKAYSIGILSDESYVLSGISDIDSAQTLAGVDTLGNVIWQKKYGPVGSRFERILIDQDTLYVIGKMNDSLTLTKSDKLGNIQWQQTYFKDQYNSSEIRHSGDGNFYISGSNSGAGNYGNAAILKVDRAGNILNLLVDQGFIAGVFYEVGSFDLTSDGGFIITGNKALNCCDKIRFLMKTDAAGAVEWERDYYDQTFSFNLSHDVIQTQDGGYVMAGQVHTGQNTTYKFNLTKTDGLGYHYTNVIAGYIFLDDNTDCSFDQNETGVANAAVRIEPGPHYAITDENGFFSLTLDSGNYTVYSAFQHPYLNQSCLLSGNVVAFNNVHEKDSSSFFGYTVTDVCPLMKVDIGTANLRRCFQSTYEFNYQNSGTDTAIGTYVEVQLDSALSLVASSIPWTVSGNTYQFQLENVDPWTSGSFTVDVDVSCNASLNSTACVQAHIYPDSNCAISSSDWDKSLIKVDGVCDGDSLIEFIIKNVSLPGVGDMDTSREYRIYEDNVLHIIGPYQLDGGDSLIVRIESDASAYVIRADQDQNNPLQNFAQTFVENCGQNSYAVGVVSQFPQDDEYGAFEVDCRQITDSWESNRKHAQPVGFSSNHYISDDQSIEYNIQFRNIGYDTVSTVIVLDTLSDFLDPATIATCASSHPYSFELFGPGIAKWTFYDINLPDSSTDEVGSHGFVQFRISQSDQNSSSTVILNNAGIYFDYGTPDVTNTNYHTVFDNSCQEYIDIGISSISDTLVISLPEDSNALLNYGPYDSLCTYIMNPIAPRNGNVSLFGESTMNYSPFPNYFGLDTVEFIICSQEILGLCDTIIVIYEIAPVNDPPTTVKDFIKLFENHQVTYDVTSNDFDLDFDQLKMSIASLPEHGQIVTQADGNLLFQPFENYIGSDSFSYQLCDDGYPSLCNIGVVSIEIEANKTTNLPGNSNDPLNRIVIYPNPIKHTATISFPGLEKAAWLHFELIDHLGIVVLSKEHSHTNAFEIQRSHHPAGMYMYLVRTDQGNTYVGKLVMK